MSIQTIVVKLLGTSFAIQTDESLEYMDKLLSKLSERFEMVKKAADIDDPIKIAIMAGIYLEDDIERLKSRVSDDNKEKTLIDLEAITDRLIARIDDTLGDNSPKRDS